MANKKTFNDEQERFIMQHYRGRTLQEMCALLEEKYHQVFSPRQIERFKYSHKLYSFKNKFEPEVVTYIKQHRSGKFHKVLCEEINEKFGTSYTTSDITNYLRFRRLTTGTKGCRPEVYDNGDTIIRKAGAFIKVDGQIVRKGRYVLEQNGLAVAPSDVVKYLDGNQVNCSLDNLVVVTRNESLRLNSNNWYTDNKYLNQVAIDTVKLQTAIKHQQRQLHREEAIE